MADGPWERTEVGSGEGSREGKGGTAPQEDLGLLQSAPQHRGVSHRVFTQPLGPECPRSLPSPTRCGHCVPCSCQVPLSAP